MHKSMGNRDTRDFIQCLRLFIFFMMNHTFRLLYFVMLQCHIFANDYLHVTHLFKDRPVRNIQCASELYFFNVLCMTLLIFKTILSI